MCVVMTIMRGKIFGRNIVSLSKCNLLFKKTGHFTWLLDRTLTTHQLNRRSKNSTSLRISFCLQRSNFESVKIIIVDRRSTSMQSNRFKTALIESCVDPVFKSTSCWAEVAAGPGPPGWLWLGAQGRHGGHGAGDVGLRPRRLKLSQLKSSP